MRKQSGQIVLILILIMTVALGIGISIIQRSLTDISTSTKVEESSRAFSAAEAGIEQALNCPGCSPTPITELSFDNQSSVQVSGGYLMPAVPINNTRQEALEFPPLTREQIAHVWLADYNSTTNPPAIQYSQKTLDVYWGSSTSDSDKAALEITLVYYNGEEYQYKKWFLDSTTARAQPNNFELVTSCSGGYDLPGYLCKKTLENLPYYGLMMVSARLLYNNTAQPVAFRATGTCGWFCSLPPQARTFISRGKAGGTERQVKLFQINKVAPPYLDYSIFSAGDITK